MDICYKKLCSKLKQLYLFNETVDGIINEIIIVNYIHYTTRLIIQPVLPIIFYDIR